MSNQQKIRKTVPATYKTEKLVGYKLRREDCGGWMFMGTTPQEVANTLRSEIEADGGIMIACSVMRIEPCEVTQEEIDNMPEFEGW